MWMPWNLRSSMNKSTPALMPLIHLIHHPCRHFHSSTRPFRSIPPLWQLSTRLAISVAPVACAANASAQCLPGGKGLADTTAFVSRQMLTHWGCSVLTLLVHVSFSHSLSVEKNICASLSTGIPACTIDPMKTQECGWSSRITMQMGHQTLPSSTSTWLFAQRTLSLCMVKKCCRGVFLRAVLLICFRLIMLTSTLIITASRLHFSYDFYSHFLS